MSMEFAAFLFLMSSVVQSMVPIVDKCNENEKLRVIEVQEINGSETSSGVSSANDELP